MTIDDFAAAEAIEHAAYTSGWSPTDFERELRTNAVARYVILERLEPDGSAGAVGFAGLWLQFDEAHVVTVAVLPGEQRHGYGRLLVHALLVVAEAAGLADATLEVRVSNEAARALYRRYGFFEVGERKRYYEDNNEDAVIMTTLPFDTPEYGKRLAHLREQLRTRFGEGVVSQLNGEALTVSA